MLVPQNQYYEEVVGANLKIVFYSHAATRALLIWSRLEESCSEQAYNRERLEKGRKDGANASSLTIRARYIIKLLGNGPVDSRCVILEMLIILQPYSTDLVLKPILFFNIGQMLLLKVLRQVSRTSKLVSALFKRQALLP